jgi:hypothetical protein
MVRPRFSDDREQKRDTNESRRPMRDTKRRQEFMRLIDFFVSELKKNSFYSHRSHQLWSGETLGIFTKKDVNGSLHKKKQTIEKDFF